MTPADPERIPVGYVRRAHGLRGEVLIRPLTDDPDRFAVGARFLTDEESPRRLEVSTLRRHKEGLLFGFVEVTERTAAESLRGVSLTIDPSERRPLGEDEYWPDQLEGLTAVDLAGADLGQVAGVIAGVGQDRLAVTTPAGDEVEVPFVAAIVLEVDLAAGVVRMDPPPGLFSD